jgi:anti-anti-sigma factor
MACMKEPIEREEVIARYLARALKDDAVEEFEAHYLGCDECFDELRLSERLAAELRSSSLAWKQTEGVSVLQFRAATELTHSAQQLEDLRREVLEQRDKRVIIDLSRVTKIDSAGLGQLMSCYSHLVRNSGALKIVNPQPDVKKLLDMTGISTLIPDYNDEREALRSFQ